MQSPFLQFTGFEIIADILEKFPPAGEILSAHGVSCAGCHINVVETLKDGVLGHGFSEKNFQDLLDDLNDAAHELEIPAKGLVRKDPILTPFAAKKIQEFQKEQETQGFGFKIEVIQTTDGETSYFLDFLPAPENGDKTVQSQGIDLYLDPESFRILQNSQIDFLEDGENSGFKIEPTPNN